MDDGKIILPDSFYPVYFTQGSYYCNCTNDFTLAENNKSATKVLQQMWRYNITIWLSFLYVFKT
jgi:hypothetical protein